MVLRRNISSNPPLTTRILSQGPSTLKIFERLVIVSLVITTALICSIATKFKFNGGGGGSDFFLGGSSPAAPTTAIATNDKSPWQSKNSAVLALASGLNLDDYMRFVGSLRATGYSGHILLGISKLATTEILVYLKQNGVTTHFIESAEQCTHHGAIGSDGKPLDTNNSHEWHCPKNYPDYKISWARFFMYKDWLNDCPLCTDGIMLTDARDAFFQLDPFLAAVKLGQQHPLLVFEEHPHMSNTHWLTDIPIKTCKDYTVGPTQVLCSGSIMGSREGIMEYLDVMQKEMADWMTKPKCRLDMRGDDQSIHNYLYYTGQLKNVKSIPHRTGAIHVVGYEAARIFETAQEVAKSGSTTNLWVRDNNWHNWLPDDPIEKFADEIQANATFSINLIDRNTGQIVNLDGSPSAQVHQFDRFGPLMDMWFHEMWKNDWPFNKAQK
ncbi:hypothetical protein ACHAXH_000827 [Discostella pseudostelligera]